MFIGDAYGRSLGMDQHLLKEALGSDRRGNWLNKTSQTELAPDIVLKAVVRASYLANLLKVFMILLHDRGARQRAPDRRVLVHEHFAVTVEPLQHLAGEANVQRLDAIW